MSELVGRLLNCRYRVDASLGRGGMAEVYKVWDEERATYLAMKLLREDLAEDQVFLRRFKREAQTLAKLQHPNIVRFYGLEQEGPLAFILMDYIEGRSLRREIFDARGPLSPQRVLEIMQSVCAALYYAHQKGFVHCDIKPGNVLIDEKGTVYLTDFGIARMTESATATMVGAGTPAYMSPEQARGEDPTPQTDIYALGVVLFEMLTGGERPFTGEHAKTTGSTGEKVRWEQLHLQPPSPSKFNPEVSPELEAVVLKCLEKEPEQRYQSALELLNAVIAAVKEEDIKREEVKRQVKEKKTETKEEHPAPAQPPASPPAAMTPRKYQSVIVIGVMLSIVAMSVVVVTGIRYLGGLGRLSGGSVPTLITLQLPVANIPPLQTFTPSPTLTQIPTNTRTPTIASTTTPNYAIDKTITVSALDLWQNTGIVLMPGDILNIQYVSGQWGWTGEARHGAIGDSQSCLEVCGPIASSCPIQAANEGALVGRIGNDAFVIGQQVTYTNNTDQAGEQMLDLRMNDCDLGVHDNFGSIEVKISVISKTWTVTIPAQITDGESLFRWCPSDWATCRNAAQGNATWVGLTVTTIGAGHDTSGFTIERGFLSFDTTSIPANATINSATLHFYTGAFLNGNTTIHVVRSFAKASLSDSDYGKIEYNSGGSITPSGPFTWFEIDIQYEALSWLSPGQIISLALIHDYDLRNTIPTSGNDVLIATTEDEQHRPYLTITYTIP